MHVLNNTCRLDGISPSVSRMTSPTSGEYENDKSDFESGSVSPKQIDEREETPQEPVGLPKKEITRSKTEASINMNQTSNVRERHSVGGILSPGADVHVDTSKQSKFSFLSKRKHSAGDYPPIPPKPSLATDISPKSSPTNSAKSSKNSTSPSPSFIKSLSPKSSAKSPPLDPPGPKTSATRSPSRSPLRSSYGKSHTLQKKDSYGDGDSRSRCATMGTQEAFHEHHMNKKRRRKSSDKGARRFTTMTDSGNAKRTTGSALINNKFDYQFSPDMEERLQLKIEQGIQNTYGPIEKCIQASITIQRYYRQKKMLQRFKTLRKEVISVAALQPSRPRALSMKLPVRAYSIRLKSHPEVQVSILDEFPEYRKLTNRIASRNKVTNQPTLQVPVDKNSKDLGPSVRWRREASLEVQETVLQISDKSVTPVRAVSITEEDTGNNDDVFSPMPTPSPEMNYSPSPESDPDQSIRQRKPSGVPTSLSVDFLSSGHEEEPTVRPHSISIMHHITRSKSMEELLVMDNKTGKPKKLQLRPQESATSLKKKTNIGITLFNRLVIYYDIIKNYTFSYCVE